LLPSNLVYFRIRVHLHTQTSPFTQAPLHNTGFEMFRFHGSDCEVSCLPVCDTILSSKDLRIFLKNLRRIYLHGNSTLKLEVSGSSEMLVYLYQTTRSHISEKFSFLRFLVTKLGKTRCVLEDDRLNTPLREMLVYMRNACSCLSPSGSSSEHGNEHFGSTRRRSKGKGKVHP
jgi:hypothetical protein